MAKGGSQEKSIAHFSPLVAAVARDGELVIEFERGSLAQLLSHCDLGAASSVATVSAGVGVSSWVVTWF